MESSVWKLAVLMSFVLCSVMQRSKSKSPELRNGEFYGFRSELDGLLDGGIWTPPSYGQYLPSTSQSSGDYSYSSSSASHAQPYDSFNTIDSTHGGSIEDVFELAQRAILASRASLEISRSHHQHADRHSNEHRTPHQRSQRPHVSHHAEHHGNDHRTPHQRPQRPHVSHHAEHHGNDHRTPHQRHQHQPVSHRHGPPYSHNYPRDRDGLRHMDHPYYPDDNQ